MNKTNRYTTSLVLVLSTCLFHTACKHDKNKAGMNKNFDFVIFDSIVPGVNKTFVVANVLPYFDKYKWGYADRQGDVVIPCEYEGCGFFSEQYAWVCKDKKFGFIDSTGKVVINLIYDGASDFIKGLAPVKKNNLYGFIDTTGYLAIPFLFEDYNFADDNTIHVKQNNQWGVIDRKGANIILPIYSDDFTFKNGMAIVSRARKQGVIAKNGKELVKCNYHNVEFWGSNKFIVSTQLRYDKALYGLIDSADNTIIPKVYLALQSISRHALIAKKDDKYGLLSGSNDTLIGFKYKELKGGNTNLLAASEQSWGFINISGDTILPFQFQDALPFYNRHAVVKSNGKYGSIDINGKTTIPFEFDKIENETDKICKVWKDKKYGFYNVEGQKITDCIFDEEDYHEWNRNNYTAMVFGKFINRLAIVGTEGQIGVINEKGELVVPQKYHSISGIDENGICIANYLGYWGLVNTTGKELTEFRYETIGRDARNGYYYAQKEFKSQQDGFYSKTPYIFGYFNPNGKLYSTIYSSSKLSTHEETITKIKTHYELITAGLKNQKPASCKFMETLVGIKTDDKFTVKDEKHKLQFEYYYNDSLNAHGPFFILITDNSDGKPLYSRYYFHQGRIIKWAGQDGKSLQISNALYAPEHDEHYRARLYLTEFNNTICKQNKQNNLWETQTNKMVENIDSNIAGGIYKKGDSNHNGQGEYQTSSDVYLNSKNQVMYESEKESDETGSKSSISYYSNGSVILTIEEFDDYAEFSNLSPSDLWNIVTKTEKTYYRNGNAFRSYLTFTNYIKPSKFGGALHQISDN